VFGNHAAVGRVEDLAGLGRQVAAEEFAEVALADETDAGGVLLGVGRQADVARDPAQVALFQVADREQGGCQLFLAQLGQKLRLRLMHHRQTYQPTPIIDQHLFEKTD